MTIRRRLAEANPAVYLPNLDMSLNNLGVLLWRTGKPGYNFESFGPMAAYIYSIEGEAMSDNGNVHQVSDAGFEGIWNWGFDVA